MSVCNAIFKFCIKNEPNWYDTIRYDMIRWGLATDWVGCAKPVNVNTMECYLRPTLVQGEKRSFNHAVGRASESNPRDTVGQEGGQKKKKKVAWLSINQIIARQGVDEGAATRTRAKSQPGKHLSTFRNLYRSKFRTVATLQQIFIRRFFFSFSFSFWLLSFVARSVETSINCQKLSKFLMTVWRLITENRFVLRRASYTRRVFSFPFSVCHFQFPQLFFIYR